jgi:hypothetical protein
MALTRHHVSHHTCRYLCRLERSGELEGISMADLLHTHGINIRHIGLLRSLVPHDSPQGPPYPVRY